MTQLNAEIAEVDRRIANLDRGDTLGRMSLTERLGTLKRANQKLCEANRARLSALVTNLPDDKVLQVLRYLAELRDLEMCEVCQEFPAEATIHLPPCPETGGGHQEMRVCQRCAAAKEVWKANEQMHEPQLEGDPMWPF